MIITLEMLQLIVIKVCIKFHECNHTTDLIFALNYVMFLSCDHLENYAEKFPRENSSKIISVKAHGYSHPRAGDIKLSYEVYLRQARS